VNISAGPWTDGCVDSIFTDFSFSVGTDDQCDNDGEREGVQHRAADQRGPDAVREQVPPVEVAGAGGSEDRRAGGGRRAAGAVRGRRQPDGERGGGEQRQPDDEHAPPAEEVTGPGAEQQQPAKGGV
jgi:hypothetical protein